MGVRFIMKVLIDTNIIIRREDNTIISQELAEFFKLVDIANISCYVHPASIEDINKDKNEERRKITLSKIKVYPPLPNPPDPSSNVVFQSVIKKSKNKNDEVDAKILYALYRNAVDYLMATSENCDK